MPKRVAGHRLETISANGGIVAGCTCGATYSPKGLKGQTGRAVALGLFVGYNAREAIKQAHEAHKENL